MDNIIPIAAAFDAYSNWDGLFIKGGHYSVTDLLAPPRIVHLRHRHKDELPPPSVEDLVSAFQGNAWHSMLERNLKSAASKERWRNRFLVESKFWERIEGRKVTGKLDCYDAVTKTLYDFKVTSTYKAMYGDTHDWEIQLNAYAWFLEVNEFPVDRLVVIMIHPDWSKRAFENDPRYPAKRIHEVELKLWPFTVREEMLRTRVRALRDSEKTPDNLLPPCTSEDMWTKNEEFAIIEPGKKRATRRLPNQLEVDKYITYRQEIGKPLGPHRVEFRPGTRTRCLSYCSVSGFCSQYHQYLADLEGA